MCRFRLSRRLSLVLLFRIVGYVNQTISLPCRTNRTSELLTVEWSKEGITPNITLLYRHGSETVEEKNPAFLNRTRLTLNGGEDGNISQTIFKLQRSDEGRYQCRTRVGKQLQVEATLELLVGRCWQTLWLLGGSLNPAMFHS
ncbi:hypothetical protein GOODEAATRI_013181 [Goodea atripinnis]|uniref:Ig-like domain-containing protein n=1 Tax=Goodea atripinnis TaxID=208336 RepID=A0ABV0PXW0_9TELE